MTKSVGKGPRSRGKKEPTRAQIALEVTWQLKGNIKRAQLEYLRIGAMLVRVRDEKLYAALHHPDIEDYAQQRLGLGRSSLYRYLQVYDWVKQSHPEWLAPKPPGFIPVLSDAGDLMWLEAELKRTNLNAETRAALEALHKKGLEGKLSEQDLAPYRHRHHDENDGLRAFLSKLRLLRKRGAELASMPPEVIADLDAAITVLDRAKVFQTASFRSLRISGKRSPRGATAPK